MEALLLIGVVLKAHVDGQAPLLALGLDVVIDLHGAASDATGTGADQDGGHLLALLQGVPGVGLKHVEAVPGHFRSGFHTAAPSFFRMSASSFRTSSGVILAWTSPSMVMTGDSPQAPRHATVSRVNRPSAEVFFFPVRPR